MAENPTPDPVETRTLEDGQEVQETPVDAPPEATDDDGQEDGVLDVDALRSELEAARKEAAKYRVKARETADALKAAKTPEEFAAIQERAQELETELQRERLGRTYSLPAVFAALIQGADDDAREAHAKALAEEFHKRPSGVGRGGLDPTDKPVSNDPAALAASIPRGRH
ncbi:hypothetical protein ACFC0S_03210 [Streptomyces sp. NPDC056084]|uniref:hypothetical protein n=1 Tax=unclassified Streptomyces TaxID=2593676 RepID=UPI0035DB715D